MFTECKSIKFEPKLKRRLLRVPWTARRSNQSILKEISPRCSLEGMMLKLKLQYFGHLMWGVDSLKKTDGGRDWGQEKGTTEDEMAGWHHWLDGHESEWTPRAGRGQEGLVCCDSWGRRVGRDWATELNWTDHQWRVPENIYFCFIDKAFDCVDKNKQENSSRDQNTRSPDLPLEKSVCRSRSNS